MNTKKHKPTKPPIPDAEPPLAERAARSRIGWRRSLRQLALLVGSFAAVSLIAWLAGAGLGVAFSFGQIGFVIALVYILAFR